MTQGVETLTCCICSLVLDQMNLVEREAHVNRCCERCSENDECDVISISSSEISENSQTEETTYNARAELPKQSLLEQVKILKPNSGSQTVDSHCEISGNVDSYLKRLHTDYPLKEVHRKDNARNRAKMNPDFRDLLKATEGRSFGNPLPKHESSQSDRESNDSDDDELSFFKNRRMIKTDLLSRLKSSGKVTELERSDHPAPINENLSKSLENRTDTSSKLSSGRKSSSGFIEAKFKELLSTTGTNKKDDAVHSVGDAVLQPEQKQQKFRCWLCGKSVELGPLTSLDHLAFCSRLNREILNEFLPDPEYLISPAMLPSTISRLDSIIEGLQKVRGCLKGLCPITEAKKPATSTEVLSSKAKPDSRNSQLNGQRPVRDMVTVSNSCKEHEQPKVIPPCPQYGSMTIPELKKLMAKYGFRAGSKSYMVQQLTLAWDALHAPSELAPAFLQESTCTEVQLPPRDTFRSPVRNRARKVNSANFETRSETIMTFIVKHECLLEHVLCLQPINIDELHDEICKLHKTVSLKDVKAFCHSQGLNVAVKWRKASQK